MPKPGNASPDYYVPAEAVYSQIGDEDFIPPETTQEAGQEISQQNFSVNLLEKPKQNRKRNFSNDNVIAHDKDAHKQSRTDIFRVSDQVSSISNLHSDENDDFWTDKSAATSQNELDNISSNDIHSELWTNEESHYENEAIQEHDLENNELTIGYTNSLNSINMDGFQEERIADDASNSEGCKEKTVFPVDEIHADAGPSNLHENIPSSNVCLVKDMKETSLCMGSEHEISKQAKNNEEKNTYQHCQCRYINNENEQHMKFCETHVSDPYFCNICKVRYSEENSHESKHLCNFCPKEFQCITQLEDHYPEHEEDFQKDCILCKREI